MSFYCFPIKNVSEMIGNTVQNLQSSLRTIISTVQISLGFSDTPLKVGYLQIFSVIRGLSPSRKSEKRVFYEIVWTSVVYLLLLNCTHRDIHTYIDQADFHSVELSERTKNLLLKADFQSVEFSEPEEILLFARENVALKLNG